MPKLNLYKQHENKFLNQLSYWAHKGKYGLEKDGKIWIYNTLDQWAAQLNVSKSTVQRVIRSLREKGILDSAYLSYNKRNRTLFYSINYEKLQNSDFSHMVKKAKNYNCNDHMVDHMYNKKHKQINNKSYKSQDSFSEKILEDKGSFAANQESEMTDVAKQVLEKPKNTSVQDMVKIFHEEFSDIPVKLDKNLAKNLVAALKLKFANSIQKWKNFLKLVKTSSYLTGEKFKLNLRWLLKFATIDRLNLGELGVKICNVFANKIPDEELQSAVDQHISESGEGEMCQTLRKQLAKKLSNAVYLNWFSKVKFEKQEDIINVIYPSKFTEDTIKIRYADKLRELMNDYAQYSFMMC